MDRAAIGASAAAARKSLRLMPIIVFLLSRNRRRVNYCEKTCRFPFNVWRRRASISSPRQCERSGVEGKHEPQANGQKRQHPCRACGILPGKEHANTQKCQRENEEDHRNDTQIGWGLRGCAAHHLVYDSGISIFGKEFLSQPPTSI